MPFVFSSNDLIELDFAKSILLGQGITPYITDVYTSNIEGSIGIFPKRILVSELDAPTSIQILRENGLIYE